MCIFSPRLRGFSLAPICSRSQPRKSNRLITKRPLAPPKVRWTDVLSDQNGFNSLSRADKLLKQLSPAPKHLFTGLNPDISYSGVR